MRLLSVETLEPRLDRDGGAQASCKRATFRRLLEALETVAGVHPAAGKRAPEGQHAVHRPEAEELGLRRSATASDARPDGTASLTRRPAPPPTPPLRCRPRSPPRPPRPRRPRSPPRLRPLRPR